MRFRLVLPAALLVVASFAHADPAPTKPSDDAPPALSMPTQVEVGGVSYTMAPPPGYLREDGLFPEFETQLIQRTGENIKIIESFLPAEFVIKGRESNWQWRAAQVNFETVYLVSTLFTMEFADVDPITFAVIKKSARQAFNGLAAQPATETTEADGMMKLRIGPSVILEPLIEKPHYVIAMISTPVVRSVDGQSDTVEVVDGRAVVFLKKRGFYLQGYSRPQSIEERLRFRDEFVRWVESVVVANGGTR